jgi:F-type H+-transporting ATPase subunit b
MSRTLLRSLTACVAFGLFGSIVGPVCAQPEHEHPLAAQHTAEGDHHAGGAEHSATEGDAHGGHGGVNYDEPPINPDRAMLQLFLFSLALFVGFVFLARQIAWKPLIQALDAREQRIIQAKRDAEAARAEAAKLLEQHAARLSEVRDEVQRIVATSRREAEEEKARIVAEGELQASTMLEGALADIRQARDEAMSRLQESIEQQIDLATEHVVGHGIGR